MQLRKADTFTASLARLPNEQQKTAKTTAFDLQLNPTPPGHSLHPVTGAKDPNFWSVRVNLDFGIIVHRGGDGMTLCYVGHHDDAYQWARVDGRQYHLRDVAGSRVSPLRPTLSMAL